MNDETLSAAQKAVDESELAAQRVLATIPDDALKAIGNAFFSDPDAAVKKYSTDAPEFVASACLSFVMRQLTLRAQAVRNN